MKIAPPQAQALQIERCVKCHSAAYPRWWAAQTVDGRDFGRMMAVCERCGYEWPIKSLDEGVDV